MRPRPDRLDLRSAQFLVADPSCRIRADCFEHILHRQRATLVLARHDRAAVQDHARERSGAAAPSRAPGIVLSQATSATMPSNMCPRATSSIESAIRSRLTSDAFMPFRAHRDAVADRDGVELHRRAAGGSHTLFHLHGKLAKIVVARHRFDPRVRDADDRLFQILVGESDSLEHGARRSTVPALRDGVAFQGHEKTSL